METAPHKESRHGSPSFPLAVYHGQPGFKRCALYSHWQEEAEFFILDKGRLRFFLGDRSFILHEGEAVFIRPGEVHAAFSEEGCPCVFSAIVFSAELLDPSIMGSGSGASWEAFLRGELELADRVLSSAASPDQDIFDRFGHVIEAVRTAPPGYELSAIAGIYEIFALLIGRGFLVPDPSRGSSRSNSRTERLKSALRFLRENYDKDIAVADIAAAVNMSQFHFARFFRKMTGSSPLEHLLKYRIARAEELLSGGDRKVQDVGERVGFPTTSHFIKIFKRYRQCTPAAYRRAARTPHPRGPAPGEAALGLAPPGRAGEG